jgi:hypothetical protein
MTPADAARKARIDLGRPDVQGEKYRNAVGLRPWDEIWGDLRYGLRGLLRNPGFAAVTNRRTSWRSPPTPRRSSR